MATWMVLPLSYSGFHDAVPSCVVQAMRPIPYPYLLPYFETVNVVHLGLFHRQKNLTTAKITRAQKPKSPTQMARNQRRLERHSAQSMDPDASD